ncbi:hypothetical protein ABPG74_015754 [Tetrahymena malaccensis]
MFLVDHYKIQNNDDIYSQIFVKSNLERVSAPTSIRYKKNAPFSPLNNKETQKPSKLVKQFLETQHIDVFPKIENVMTKHLNSNTQNKSNCRRSISQNSAEISQLQSIKSPDNLQKSQAYCYNNRQICLVQDQKLDLKKNDKIQTPKRDLTFNDLLAKVSRKIAESELRNSPINNTQEQNESPANKTKRIFQLPLCKTRQKGFSSCPKDKKYASPPIYITQYSLNNQSSSHSSPKAIPQNQKFENNFPLKENVVQFLKTSIDKNQIFPSTAIISTKCPKESNKTLIDLNKMQNHKPCNHNESFLFSQNKNGQYLDMQRSLDEFSLSQANESTMIEAESIKLPTKYQQSMQSGIQYNQKKFNLPKLTSSSQQQYEKLVKQQANNQSIEGNNSYSQLKQKLYRQEINLNVDPSFYDEKQINDFIFPTELNIKHSQQKDLNFNSLTSCTQAQTVPHRSSIIKNKFSKQYFQNPKQQSKKDRHFDNKNIYETNQDTSNGQTRECQQNSQKQDINKESSFLSQQSPQNKKIEFNPPLQQTKKQRSKSPRYREINKHIAPPKQITAQSWSVFDFENNSLIDGKLCYVQREVASLTKLMTFYVAYKLFESLQLDIKLILLQVTESCTQLEGTSAKLVKDTWLSVLDLFHGLLLPSGNDCAELIAIKIGAMLDMDENKQLNPQMDMFQLNSELDKRASQAKMIFIVKMNEFCKSIGMHSTFFSNVTGLPDSNNVSTAYDIGLLCIECMQIPIFRQIVRKQEYIADVYDNQSEKTDKIWFNTNKLLTNGFCGIKTGITQTAGPCLASFIKIKDSETGIKKQIVIVLLDCYTVEDRWEDSYLLAKWAIKAAQNNKLRLSDQSDE